MIPAGATSSAVNDFPTLRRTLFVRWMRLVDANIDQLFVEGMIFVPSAAELTATPVVGVRRGQIAYVGNPDPTSLSFRDYFRYEPDSPFTNDEVRFVTPNSGTGSWVRMLIPDLYWQSVSEWFVDPGNILGSASDEHPGTSQGLPLRTMAELLRRVTGGTNQWVPDVTAADGVSINPIVHINSSLLADDHVSLDFQSRATGASLTFQPSLDAWVSNNGGLLYNVTAVTPGVPAANTLPSITLDRIVASGDLLYDTSGNDQLIRVLVGAASGAPVIILRPAVDLVGGEALILVDPITVQFVQLTGSSVTVNVNNTQPIDLYNLTQGPGAVDICEVHFQNCRLTSCAVLQNSASEPSAVFTDCNLVGTDAASCAFRGYSYVLRGGLSNVYFESGFSTLINATISDVMLYDRITDDPAIQIASGARIVMGTECPVGIASNSSVFVLEHGAVLDARTANAIYGTMAGTGFVVDFFPRSLVTAPAGASWCTIAGTRLRANQSATPNTWQPQPTSNAANTPTFAAMTTFASLFAAPFAGWAKHPFTEALISNGA